MGELVENLSALEHVGLVEEHDQRAAGGDPLERKDQLRGGETDGFEAFAVGGAVMRAEDLAVAEDEAELGSEIGAVFEEVFAFRVVLGDCVGAELRGEHCDVQEPTLDVNFMGVPSQQQIVASEVTG